MFRHPSYTIPRVLWAFWHPGYTIPRVLWVFSPPGYTIPRVLWVFRPPGYTIPRVLWVFRHPGYTIPRVLWVFRHPSYTIRTQAIQSCVCLMPLNTFMKATTTGKFEPVKNLCGNRTQTGYFWPLWSLPRQVPVLDPQMACVLWAVEAPRLYNPACFVGV